MIVVTGGNGQLGRQIVRALQERIGNGFIVTARDAGKATDLAAQGITVRAGDFDKADEIARAIEGGDTILLMATLGTTEQRVRQYKNLIDAAKRQGTKRIVFVGYLADQPESPFPSTPSILQTLTYLREQGFAPINLRNGNYAEAGLMTAQRALQAGKIVSPAGSGKISYVTRRDLARATARLLAEPGNEGKDFALTGPKAYGHEELAAMLSEVTGRKIVYEDISPESYKAQVEAANTPPGLVAFMTGAAATVKGGYLAEVSYTIGDLTGIPAEDGLTFIRREVQKTLTA
ncbi:MAG TPA: SDR family oxidoreductase [Stellaceae bacterium]